MSDQIWYLYQNGQQMGPFDTQQVLQLYHKNMISNDAYVFKVGWKDWLPIEESYEALGLKQPETPKAISAEEAKARAERRIQGAPRATISGRVVVHNNGQLTIGQGVNISAEGIFVETSQQIFTVGESLKLSVKASGMPKAFNAVAVVMRYSDDKRFPVGYGLRFLKIDPQSKETIKRLVKEANNRGDSGRFVAK